MQADPYYLLWEWRNTQAPDTFLEKFTLRSDDADIIRRKYDDALNSDKTPAYSKFESMANQDQLNRYKAEKCADIKSCKIVYKNIYRSDSANFAFLRSDVADHGWPAMKDGSMYATLLAIHDHANYPFYMPYLKKAVKAGRGDINALELINLFLKRTALQRKTDKIMADKDALRFNISEVLQGKLPRFYSVFKLL